MTFWPDLTTNDEAARRAGGRRNYNAFRQRQALQRRAKVLTMLKEYPNPVEHGIRARLARELGVSRSTISRDLAFLFYVPRETLPPLPRPTSDAEWIRTLEPLGERLAAEECVCGETEEPRHRLGHVLKMVAETLDSVERGKITLSDDAKALFTRVRDVLCMIL
jgi:hypothetical protein